MSNLGIKTKAWVREPFVLIIVMLVTFGLSSNSAILGLSAIMQAQADESLLESEENLGSNSRSHNISGGNQVVDQEVFDVALQSAGEVGTTGSGYAYADFNGDGKDDLAIGVPEEDITTIQAAGAVNVLYGSSSGLRTSAAADKSGRADQFWHQGSTNVIDTLESGDRFGSSLAAGDFNGDGFGDLAIGVPGEKVGSIGAAGAVNVIYGSASGLQTSSPASQFWHQNSAGVDDAVESFDSFGSSLASGDFNGDDRDDLAIGVRGEAIGSLASAGAVNVLYGSSSGLRTSAAGDGTGRVDQFWHQDISAVEDVAEAEDQFGWSLAAADFNGDNKDDLAIGVPFEDVSGISNAGAVNVLYGHSSGLRTISPSDQFWHQNSADVADALEVDDFFGYSLAAGDFNNLGGDDLAIGVPFENSLSGGSNTGAVNVLYGTGSGLQATSPADQFWHNGSGGFEDDSEAEQMFGYTLAAGDFNGDVKDDLAIGKPFEDVGGVVNGGEVIVLYGSTSGLQTSSPAAQVWHQNSAGVEDAAEADDRFGWSLSAGDFNGDGRDELAIGVPREDIVTKDGTVNDAGAVNVLYSSVSGLQISSPADQLWHQDRPGMEDAVESGDRFGSSLA